LDDAMGHATNNHMTSSQSSKTALAKARADLSAGRYQRAVSGFRTILARTGERADLLNDLGVALREVGRLEEAEKVLRKAESLNPGAAEPSFNLALLHKAQGRLAALMAALERAVARDPGLTARGWVVAGQAHEETNRREKGLACYQKALEADPEFLPAHALFGVGLAETDRHVHALPHLEKVHAAMPEDAGMALALARTLYHLNRGKDAIPILEVAKKRWPDMTALDLEMAKCLREVGDLAGATALLESVIETAPAATDAFFLWGSINRFRTDHPVYRRLTALSARLNDFESGQKTDYHYAMAKATQDLRNFDEAFRHFRAAAALKFATMRTDERKRETFGGQLASLFTPDFMERCADGGDPTSQPIFIVGMPRSGSTLIEQVLSRHPRVATAGETPCLDQALHKAGHITPEGLGLPPRNLAKFYLDGLYGLVGKTAKRITDKALENYNWIPVIHLMFPNAAIIHAVRDPMDTCVSCFEQPFKSTKVWTYDLGELGRQYRRYRNIMARHEELLPGRVVDIRYEDLVSDPESQIRRLVEACGLPWNDACLRPEDSERPVSTASVVQVRRPIHGGSVGRWRRYEKYLGPLIEALGDAVEVRESESAIGERAEARRPKAR